MTQPDPNTPPADPARPPEQPATGTQTAAAPTAKPDDKPLGPNGEKALRAEREARAELEKRLAALAPLEKLAAAMGGGDADKGKTEIEQLRERQSAMETMLTEERTLRMRLEVAAEKGLSHLQASRLVGATREEMAADADSLLALFPSTPAKPGNPAPDPTQGAAGGVPDIDSRIAEAQKAGKWRDVMHLQNEKLAALMAAKR